VIRDGPPHVARRASTLTDYVGELRASLESTMAPQTARIEAAVSGARAAVEQATRRPRTDADLSVLCPLQDDAIVVGDAGEGSG